MANVKRTDDLQGRRGGRSGPGPRTKTVPFTLEGAEVDVWHYHDGPIFGVLRKDGREFLFEVERAEGDRWDLYPRDDDGNDTSRNYILRELVHTHLHVNEQDLAGDEA